LIIRQTAAQREEFVQPRHANGVTVDNRRHLVTIMEIQGGHYFWRQCDVRLI